jgi:hypothetical protein
MNKISSKLKPLSLACLIFFFLLFGVLKNVFLNGRKISNEMVYLKRFFSIFILAFENLGIIYKI